MSKKQKIIAAVIGLIVAIFGGSQLIGGGGQVTVPQTLAGSADVFTAMPVTYAESANTTTGAVIWDTATGGTIQQQIAVDGITSFTVAGEAEGGTATSSLYIKQQISIDGTNFFEITGNTTTTDKTATSTGALIPKVFSFDPSVATTSFSYTFDIPAAKFLRLLFMADDLSTDPNDGVKAFIQVGLEQGTSY